MGVGIKEKKKTLAPWSEVVDIFPPVSTDRLIKWMTKMSNKMHGWIEE
jgi:hypothetical protein